MSHSSRITLLSSYPRDPAVPPVQTLGSITLVRHDYETFDGHLERALDVLDPLEQLVPRYGPGYPREVGWAVRPLTKVPSEAHPSDYETPESTWAVRDTGELSHPNWVYRRPMIVDDLVRAASLEYNKHDYEDIVIWRSDGGRGGDGVSFDIVEFLLNQGVAFGVGYGTHYLLQFQALVSRVHRTRKADAQARLAAARWRERGLDAPFTLREWIDLKQSWRIAEVAERLDLDPPTAALLLRALGYEATLENRELWVISSRRKAEKRRKKWLKAETDAWLPEVF